ncbi:glycosyltransferase [Algibacter mikhailovii]|uniref:glycosyltransferase n=1 Tax=Algibacter mikhailovii TaxID=425498 RepID=UPI0024941D76|nr:glycosyltransferase [Algibacter mikhailovii]
MQPLLSICCTSYNHEKFIKDTIDGFLMQKTDFPIEIIIHDDASTDKSAEIINDYAHKDDRIITILQTENQYSQKIKPWASFLFPKARGKYIALCEGDDYWTDPLKLQKQVDFLENHEDYNICFNKSKIYYQNEGVFGDDFITGSTPETTTIEDVVIRNYIPTNTVVLRNNFELPKWFNLLPMGDWPLLIIQVKNKKIKYFNEEMGVYRIHDSAVWSGKSKRHRINKTLETLEPILKHVELTSKAKKILSKQIRKFKIRLLKEKIRGFLRNS